VFKQPLLSFIYRIEFAGGSRKFEMSGVSSAAVQRLRKDAARLAKDPVPFVLAVPLQSNILEWHYVVRGPPDSPYEDGYYHGKLVFPKEYPFKPPSIYMLTPNGRFQVNTRLCLSISDFHPDTWNPAWSVGTILTGLLSFMLETSPTLGSIETSDYEKRQLSKASGPHNLKNKTFRELFPDLCQTIQSEIEEKMQPKKLLSSKRTAASSGSNSDADQSVPAEDHGQEEGGDDADPFRPLDESQSRQDNANGAGYMNPSTMSNLLVFAGVVAFVFMAKYVLQTAD